MRDARSQCAINQNRHTKPQITKKGDRLICYKDTKNSIKELEILKNHKKFLIIMIFTNFENKNETRGEKKG